MLRRTCRYQVVSSVSSRSALTPVYDAVGVNEPRLIDSKFQPAVPWIAYGNRYVASIRPKSTSRCTR